MDLILPGQSHTSAGSNDHSNELTLDVKEKIEAEKPEPSAKATFEELLETVRNAKITSKEPNGKDEDTYSGVDYEHFPVYYWGIGYAAEEEE